MTESALSLFKFFTRILKGRGKILSLAMLLFMAVAGANYQAMAESSGKELAGSEKQEEGLNFDIMVVAKQPEVLLALYNTLSAPVDEESLARLGRHCYEEVRGDKYQRVLISWFLPNQTKDKKPWAVTNYTDKEEFVEILDEDLASKYPSIKYWNQKGHEPIR